MNSTKQSSVADVADRHRSYAAIAMLLAGLIYLAMAVELLVDEATAQWLEYGIFVLAIGAAAALMPLLVAKIRLPRSERVMYFSKDGYVAELERRASKISLGVTFVSLAVLGGFAEKANPDDFPAVFFIRIGLFIMLAVMSITFLTLNWIANRDIPGDET